MDEIIRELKDLVRNMDSWVELPLPRDEGDTYGLVHFVNARLKRVLVEMEKGEEE